MQFVTWRHHSKISPHWSDKVRVETAMLSLFVSDKEVKSLLSMIWFHVIDDAILFKYAGQGYAFYSSKALARLFRHKKIGMTKCLCLPNIDKANIAMTNTSEHPCAPIFCKILLYVIKIMGFWKITRISEVLVSINKFRFELWLAPHLCF